MHQTIVNYEPISPARARKALIEYPNILPLRPPNLYKWGPEGDTERTRVLPRTGLGHMVAGHRDASAGATGREFLQYFNLQDKDLEHVPIFIFLGLDCLPYLGQFK